MRCSFVVFNEWRSLKMAFFGVTKEKIEKVWAHPNADRLELGKLENLSFQFVIVKGQFKAGDEVLYFPLDAELPPPLQEALGLTGKLAGCSKNRVKTIKLRGEISQGVVGHVSLLSAEQAMLAPQDLTNSLGVTKYDPPPIISQTGTLVPLPAGYSAYDIEGAERCFPIVEHLSNATVVVLEKLEGTNFSVGITHDAEIFVNQRNFSIIETAAEEHLFWKVARASGLITWLREKHSAVGGDWIVYGELCGPGIQNNIYELKSHELFVFDVRTDYRWLPWNQVKSLSLPVRLVPELFVGNLHEYLGGETVQKASNGPSILGSTIREGIVIKGFDLELTAPAFGRMIIKQRSPEYLAAEDSRRL
jgi:RNA ligase (TIGR02306 family)